VHPAANSVAFTDLEPFAANRSQMLSLSEPLLKLSMVDTARQKLAGTTKPCAPGVETGAGEGI
jgi:hypothetical protein